MTNLKRRRPELRSAAGKMKRTLVQHYHRWRDFRHTTYSVVSPVDADLYLYFPPLPVADLRPYAAQIAALAGHALAHRFDLLGSGWVQVRHGMACAGVEGSQYPAEPDVEADPDGLWLTGRINRANLGEARHIWRLVDPGYAPIDWHLDFKSGFRWPETCWYRDIRYGHVPGVDIKVPWELARSQHLPQLAWAYVLASVGEPGFAPAERYVHEFRNTVLDFIATNPPRFGVNWACTMDVGIRITNWLITYDLFRAYGAEFDQPFVWELLRSTVDHARHIAANLEWQPGWRSNHYLADIAGLMFASAYLPTRPEVDRWLAFALRELDSEIAGQFYPEGSNFEASTSYHRLSAEMIVYTAALALGLPAEKRQGLGARERSFPSAHCARLEKMAEFTWHITKPSGHVPQIGDHDSGRFLKLLPVYHPMTISEARALYANLDGYQDLPNDALYYDEDLLDHRHLVAAINGLFDRDDLARSPETTFVRGIAQGITFPSYQPPRTPRAAEMVRIGGDWANLSATLGIRPGLRRQAFLLTGEDLRAGLQTFAYPDFGLFIFRSPRLYLAIRCGSIGQQGSGGHAHNDQLAIELVVDGEDLVTDPGTYLYTPLPAWRNRYRSVKAHFAPQLPDGEPGRLDLDLFRLGNEARADCLFFGPEGFLGRHQGYSSPLYRWVKLEKNSIVIEDWIEDGRGLREYDTMRWPAPGTLTMSPKYGVRLRPAAIRSDKGK